MADAPAPPPLSRAVWRWYALVAASAVVAIVLDALSDIAIVVRGDDFIVLAVFYVVAQATERLVEPLISRARVAPQTDAIKGQVGRARTELAMATRMGDMEWAQRAHADGEGAQRRLAGAQKERTVVGWAIASSFALVVCGLLGLGLIGAVSEVEAGSDFWRSVFARADVVVTGLAVGAGTKPLHDLITRIEKSKDRADPATEPAVPAPS